MYLRPQSQDIAGLLYYHCCCITQRQTNYSSGHNSRRLGCEITLLSKSVRADTPHPPPPLVV
ncbi:hypothetical protein INR49_024184 [Caranx melampygus]|nr:hypothetical protein INR49_024184 [Caranx melampygus]